MKKTVFLVALTSVLWASCGEEKDPFLISNGAIGNLNKEIMMKQIDSIFANDSIVKLNPIENALGTQGEVEIYEKGGAKLLLLSPEDENDPNATITNIQIFDNRYKTATGIHKGSTFGELKAQHEVTGLQNAINSVVVFLKDSDLYITIDKKELPENIRYNYNATIEVSQIPNEATFKYFMVGWDAEDQKEETQDTE